MNVLISVKFEVTFFHIADLNLTCTEKVAKETVIKMDSNKQLQLREFLKPGNCEDDRVPVALKIYFQSSTHQIQF